MISMQWNIKIKNKDEKGMVMKNKIDVGRYVNDDNNILREDLVEGRNAVIEALKSDNGKTIEQIFVAGRNVSGSLKVIIAMAKEKNIIIKKLIEKN